MTDHFSPEYMKRINVPEVYWGRELSDFPAETSHFKVVEKLVAQLDKCLGQGAGLYLWGDTGTGKTALASVIIKAVLKLRKSALMLNMDDLIDHSLKDSQFDDYETWRDRMQSVDLLVIDEMTLAGRDYRIAALERVVRRRIMEAQSIVVTSNIGPDHIGSKADGLAAAMKEALVPVRVSGIDYRSDKQAALRRLFT